MSQATNLEAKSLRNALGAFATGVTIVTTRDSAGRDVGLTVNSFSSVSLDPPMVLWSLAKASASIEAFRASVHFAVHILAADQDALSNRFATRGIDKFAGLGLERGPDDIPLIGGCAARFECRTAYQYEGGDHVIFVGEVVTLVHLNRTPLVFHGGRYGLLITKEQHQPAAEDEPGSALSPDDLIYHLSRAFYQIRHDAQQERWRRGWTDPEYAALSVLGREDGLTVAEIGAMGVYRGDHVTTEVIAGLKARGLVQAGDPVRRDTPVHLTPLGRRSIIEITAMLKAAEADALEGLDFSELQLLKQLLKRFVRKQTVGWPPPARETTPQQPKQ